MPSAELVQGAVATAQRSRRFAVAWRNTSRGLIAPVGVLDYDDVGYRFEYLHNVDQIPDFRPFWASQTYRVSMKLSDCGPYSPFG